MNILITGLCLAGNRGGGALADSLMRLIQDQMGPVRFSFALPRGALFADEKKQANRYGVAAVENVDPRCFLPPWSFSGERRRRKKAFLLSLKEQDLVVDVSGISYVGSAYRSWTFSIYDAMWGWLARRKKRPFLRWTQTYGPFTGLVQRFVAKQDLSRQTYVFCRGDISRGEVARLLGREEGVYAFPDVAILLPYERKKGDDLLMKVLGRKSRRIVTLSPSVVIDNYDRKRFDGKIGYRDLIARIVDALREAEYDPVFVPHAFFGKEYPERCDWCLADSMNQQDLSQPIPIVSTGMDPRDIKSILAASCFHIGSRYHSLVGALSSGVPSVALGWHHKYTDLMKFYEQADGFVDLLGFPSREAVLEKVRRLLSDKNARQDRILRAQKHLEELVHENARLFVDAFRRQSDA